MFNLIKFELKKLHKKNVIYIIFLLALIMSVYSYYKTSPSILRFTHNETSSVISDIYYSDIKNYLYDVQVSDFELSEKINQDFDVFLQNKEVIRLKEQDEFYSEDEILSLSLDNTIYFKSLIEKYNIPLEKEIIDSIDYSILRTAYSIKNKIPIESLNSLGARLFFFGVDYTFGIAPLFIFIFLLGDLVTKEYEKQNIVLLKTLPVKFKDIIISKYKSILLMLILYTTFILTIYIGMIYFNGEKLSLLNNIFRVLDGNNNYIYLWEYFFICILLFATICLSFFTMIFFLSFVFKSSIKVLLVIFTLFISLYILNITNIFDFHINPIKLLSFRDYILGSYNVTDPTRMFTLKTRIDPLGIKYYLFLVIFSCIPLISWAYYNKFNSFKLNKNLPILKKGKVHFDLFPKMFQNNLLLFEYRKVNNSFSFVAFISIIIIISFLLHFSMEKIDNLNTENRLEKFSEVNYLNKEINLYNNLIQKSVNKIENADSNNLSDDLIAEQKDLIPYYKNSIKDLKKTIKYYEIEKTSYYNNDSKAFNDNLYKLYPLRFPKSYANNVFEFNPENPSDASEFSKAISYANINELNKRNINPILGNDFLLSKYDIPINSYIKDYYQNESTPYTHDGLYSFYRGNEHYNISNIIMALIFIFLSGGYTLDKEFKNNIILLYTQPVNRHVYQDKKYIFYLINTFLLLILFNFIWFLFGFIMDGLGQLDYPIVFYEKVTNMIYNSDADFSDYFSFISIQSYILSNSLMMFCFLIYSFSLSNLVSVFVKKKSNVILITSLIVFLGYLITKYISNDIIMSISPFAYINTSSVADGSVKIFMENDKMTLLYGVLSCCIFTIVNYILEYFIIDKIDIRL